MTNITADKVFSRRLYIFLSLLVISIFIFRVVQTAQLKNSYGTVDLRNRIVGARLTLHKKTVSPYYYKWKRGEGENFLDPYDTPDIHVNRTTVTPFVLQLLQPFSDNQYQSVAIGWYITEILALLLMALLVLLQVNDWQCRFYILAVTLLFFGCSQGWLLHNLNGQLYIFYALLMALLYQFYTSSKKLAPVLCGLLLTIFVLMRPVASVFVIPFVVNKKWKPLLYFSFFILLYFIQQYVSKELWLWQDYLKAMNEWAVQLFSQNQVTDYIDIYSIKTTEGSPAVARSPFQGLAEDSSLQGMAFRLLRVKMLKEYLMITILLSFAVLLFIYRKKIKTADAGWLFVFSFLLYIITEINLPAIRNSYNYVQWVFPVLIILPFICRKLIPSSVLLLAGIFALGFLKVFPFDLLLAEVIFAVLCFYYLNTETTHA